MDERRQSVVYQRPMLALTIVYFMAMAGLALYGVHRLWLLWHWWHDRQGDMPAPPWLPGQLPRVTIQLPLYNERFVAARLIDAAAAIDWPRDRLEIQVLDDSSDDTVTIAAERVDYWRRQGIAITLLHRDERAGFKAGALAAGMRHCRGDFIAVFDADFLPPADFLQRTMPYFQQADVGMVQTRWGFLNEDSSWLTRLQSLLLNPHFTVEHQVRYRRGLFFNFNGTAGVWRRLAIDGAGGWQSDTVTEDLDLSYRAQLAGWRFVYRNDVVVPSELPATLGAFRRQQQRWAKGSMQTARKLLPRLLRSGFPLPVKIEACAHLLANAGWLLGAVATLTIYPAIRWRADIGPYQLVRFDLPLFFGTSGALLLFFTVCAIGRVGRSSLLTVPLLPLLTVGLAPCLSFSVLKGLFQRGGFFERTPKFGLKGEETLAGLSTIYRQGSMFVSALNLTLLGYSLLPLLLAWERKTWLALPFLVLFPVSFLVTVAYEVKESRLYAAVLVCVEGRKRGSPPQN